MRVEVKDFTGLLFAPAVGSKRIKLLNPRDEVQCWSQADDIAIDAPEKVAGFVYVKENGGQVGWIDQAYLEGYQREEIYIPNFIAACLWAEDDVNSLPDTLPWFVSADFLIARALLETKISNVAPRASGPGGFGPLVVTRDEWAQFLTESTEQDQFGADGWDDPIQQIWAAAFRMRRDARSISSIMRQNSVGDSGDPFVPTFLDVFHAYLTDSPESAVALFDSKNGSAVDVLDGVLNRSQVDAILDRYPNQFGSRTQPISVAALRAATEALLDSLFAQTPALVRAVVPGASVPVQVDRSPRTATGGPLGELIARGEGNYNSYNRGRAGVRGLPLTTILSKQPLEDIMKAQSLRPGNPNRLFAVGKYQLIPTTLASAVRALSIGKQETFTPVLQEHLFRHYLVARKRPKIKNYIIRNGSSLQEAQLALAQEFASVASPLTGRSYYAGTGGNAASISVAAVTRALQDERELYASFLAAGLGPSDAWDALSFSPHNVATTTLPLPQPSPIPAISRGKAKLNINLAVQHLRAHAQPKSIGQCARYVRNALEAGGLKAINSPERPVNAKDYGPVLKVRGFYETVLSGELGQYDPLEGDVVVLQPYSGGNPAGHIAMFSGEDWISDFVQRDIWAGPGYRAKRPHLALYRA